MHIVVHEKLIDRDLRDTRDERKKSKARKEKGKTGREKNAATKYSRR